MSEAPRIVASYRIRCAQREIEARARALAIEQSVEMPVHAVRSDWVRANVVGRVDSIEADGDAWRVTLGLSAPSAGDEPGQLLNVLFGNCSLQPDVELLDARLPPAILEAMPGPAFGIEGLRELVGAQGRALTCTALKPQGLPAAALAELASQFARAGIDVIKDDHGIADQAYSRFDERVVEVQRAVDRANRETGGRSVYAPSVSGGPARLVAQLRTAHRAGVRCVLACPMVLGTPAFAEVVRGHGGLAILAHPSLAGAARIGPALLLGRLFRLFGADATIFPNFGGRFAYDRRTCRAIAQAAREPLGAHRPALPVPAGGMSVERVDEMLGEFGADTMLLIGGNLLEAGDALAARAREFVARVRDAGGGSGGADGADHTRPARN